MTASEADVRAAVAQFQEELNENAPALAAVLEGVTMKTRELVKIEIVTEGDNLADVSYLDQEEFKDRKEAYERGAFGFVGIYARAKVDHHKPNEGGGYQFIGTTEYQSGGLWGIEDDSGREYLQAIADEQEAELKEILKQEGFTEEEIADAPVY